MKKTAVSFLCLSLVVSTLMPVHPEAWADAWDGYQVLNAEQAAQNQQLLKNFAEGKISSQELEAEWKKMFDAASQKAREVEDEWSGKQPPAEAEAEPVEEAAPGPAEGTSPAPSIEKKTAPEPAPAQTPLEADGGASGSFSEVTDLEAESAPVEYRSGGEDARIRKQTGLKKFTNIVIRKEDLEQAELTAEELEAKTLQGIPDFTSKGRNRILRDSQLPGAGLQDIEQKLTRTENLYETARTDYEAAREDLQEDLQELPESAENIDVPGNLTIVRQWMLFHLAGRLLLMLILLRWLYMALLILYADLGLGTSFLIQARGGFPGFAVRRLLGRDLHFGENRSEQHY